MRLGLILVFGSHPVGILLEEEARKERLATLVQVGSRMSLVQVLVERLEQLLAATFFAAFDHRGLDQHLVFARIAVLLDLRLAHSRRLEGLPQLIERDLLTELESDLGPAGEIDAQLQAVRKKSSAVAATRRAIETQISTRRYFMKSM